MFSLIAVVCQGFSCISFTPSVLFSTEEQCIAGGGLLFNVLEDDSEKTLKDMKCVEWQVKV